MKMILWSLLLIVNVMFGAETIGKVIAVEGAVEAIGSSEAGRVLGKGSAIYVAETIVVSSGSKAQIKFSDGGLINLIADTQFRVDEYRSKMLMKKDRFSAELLKGGFRSLSGSIAKKNPDEYEIKTPTSTIGIRGTIIEARIVEGQVYFACPVGQVMLVNQFGTAMIGPKEKAQFALISSSDAPAELLLERPKVLERSLFTEPKGGQNIDQVQQKQQGNKESTAKTAPSQPSATQGSESSATEGSAASSGSTTDSSAAPAEGASSESVAQEGSGTESAAVSSEASSESGSSEEGADAVQLDSFAQPTTESGTTDFQSIGGGVSISGGC